MMLLVWLVLLVAAVIGFIFIIDDRRSEMLSDEVRSWVLFFLLVVIIVADFLFFYGAVSVPVLREAIGIVVGIAGVVFFVDAVKNRHERPFRFVIGVMVGVAMLLMVAGVSVFLTEPLVRWAFR